MSEIEIRNLTKKFEVKGHIVDALRDISLTIEKGDIFGIIGMSGAGKSTLVRSINFLEKPTDGQVFVGGVDLATLGEKELRKKLRIHGNDRAPCHLRGALYRKSGGVFLKRGGSRRGGNGKVNGCK